MVLSSILILSQANPGITLPGRDYGIFSYIGQQILSGNLPYKDAWDHKPPAIFYVNALGLWLAHGFRWGIWLLEFISLTLAIGLSYRLLKKLWGTLPSIFGAAIWLYGLYITLEGGNRVEEFPLPLHFLALILFLQLLKVRQNYIHGFILGLAFSISFLFRANNAMVETAVVLTLVLIWISQRSFQTLIRQLMSMAAGALLPILVTGIYFWWQGIFKEMFDASIIYNLVYSETKMGNTFTGAAGFEKLGMIAWVGLIGFGTVLILLIKHLRVQTKPSAILPLLLIGCPLALVVTDPAGRNYAHYFINWLPFIALLSGLIFYIMLQFFPFRTKIMALPESYFLGFTLIIVSAILVFSGLGYKNWKAFMNVLQRSTVERDSAVSIYVRKNTRPEEQVLFWGGFPGENFMARRVSPSAYITYPLLLDADLSTQFSNQFLHDLVGNRPVLIVDMEYGRALSLDPKKRAEQRATDIAWPFLPANIDDVFNFIDHNYHVDTVFHNSTVYRLNGTSPP
jgi:hypothetical protein